MDWKAIQKRLKALGYDPGPADGVPGRRTAAAVAKFQKDSALAVKWPGTVGPKTLDALFSGKKKVEDSRPSNLVLKPWLILALSKKGLHESKDYLKVAAFLKSDGKTLGDPRKLPWCGDFVETCIATTLADEPLPTNPYLARNWLKCGKATKPNSGAIAVFWRGKKTGSAGHVGFAVGQSSANIYVLGGNQSDAVSIAPVSKSRLLGMRWPSTAAADPSIGLPTMTGGKLSVDEL